MKKEKVISQALQRYKDAEEAWSENRDAALDDLKFARLGEQWPDDIKRQRELDGRPCLTYNRLPSFIRQVVNDARLNSPSIKVHPVDSFADPETADVINGLIRNIEETSNAEVAFDHALESAVTCGLGYFRIDMNYTHNDAFELDLKISRIANPLAVVFDPHSMDVDASDWNYCFVVDEMSQDEFKASYPNADTSNWDNADNEGWVTEDSVRICEYWLREEIDTEIYLLSNGMTINKQQFEANPELFLDFDIVKSRPSKTYKVTQYLMTAAEILEETAWPGIYIPIVPVLGDEIIIEGKRYFLSLVRPAKDAQRNYNYQKSAYIESLSLRTKAPWVGPVGAFDTDSEKWASANSVNHAYLEYDGQIPPSQIQPGVGDMASLQAAMGASDELKNIMGIHDASLGVRSNETSGVAIKARQREGDVSTFHFIDNLSRAIKYAGKVLLDLIPHVYNTPRVMRVLGYDGEPDAVQVNQEFIQGQAKKLHDLTKGKYDLVVETGPSFSTQREEAATQMTELLRSFPQAAPIIGDLVAKNLDWPGADEIAKRLKTMLPPQIQAMEKMDGLPPEAQAAVAQAQQQINQLTEMIKQGKQMLVEKDDQIKGYELEKKSKDSELQIRELDSQRRYEADMAKIQADLIKAEGAENEKNRRFVMEEVTGTLKQQLEERQEAMQEQIIQVDNRVKNKVMRIQAPSGETYDAEVIDGNITINAPSGKTYTGQVEEI